MIGNNNQKTDNQTQWAEPQGGRPPINPEGQGARDAPIYPIDPQEELNNQRLKHVDNAVRLILKGGERDIDRQALLLQEQLVDAGLNNQSLNECRNLLNKAQKGSVNVAHGWAWEEREKYARPYDGGTPLWGSFLIDGGLNLVTAAPKVGKSALMVHLAACVFRGDKQCLGADIHRPFDHLVILGTDMSESGWLKLFAREGLASIDPINHQLLWFDKRITLISSGSDVCLDSSGIELIRAECSRHSNSLLLVDTLRSVTTKLGIDEYRPEITRPLYQLKSQLDGLSVTTVVNHHENKSGNGLAAVAGSSALTGAVDVVLSMQWLYPTEQGLKQDDDRRYISSQGRLVSDSLVIELADDDETGHWVSHGPGDEVMANAAREKFIADLQGRELQIMNGAWELWDSNQYLTVPIAADRTNLNRKLVDSVIKRLMKKGLLIKCGDTLSGTVGRPSLRYRPYDSLSLEHQFKSVAKSLGLSDLADGSPEREEGGFTPFIHRSDCFQIHGPEGDKSIPGPETAQQTSETEQKEQIPTNGTNYLEPPQDENSFPLPDIGSIILYRDKPAMVMEHKGMDLMVTAAIQIRGSWITADKIKRLARWELDAFPYKEPPQAAKDEPTIWG